MKIQTDEELTEHYRRQYARIKEIVQGWADLAEYYRLKNETLKHENNMLRCKVSKQYRHEQIEREEDETTKT